MRLVATSAAVFASAVALAASGSSAPAHAAPNTNDNKDLPKSVTVQSGDYLSKIARENDSNWKRMFYANPKIEHPDVIHPGNKLKVPADGAQLNKRPIPGYGASPAPAPQPAAPAAAAAPAPQPAYTAPAPAPQPAYNPAPAASASAASGGVWDRLAQCESGGNWSINTGNGFYGGLQFTPSSWRAAGGTGLPHQASKAEQIARAQQLQSMQGWGAWPACSAKLGLR